MRRLYGVAGAERVFGAHVVVVGIGGVGSWVAEGLARSGVRRLTLIDLDHLSESNINRQIHALDTTLGVAKVLAMRERIRGIHPGCIVHAVDDMVSPDNWPGVLQRLHPMQPGLPLPDALHGALPDALVDACDQVRAKTALAAWSRATGVPLVAVGAAGGKREPQAVAVADLADVTHDPLLAQLRYRLRKHHQAPRSGRMGVPCVFSREPVAQADASCAVDAPDGSLNCHGYGSVVSVTATFGMCAAGWVINRLAANGAAPVAAAKAGPRNARSASKMTL